MFNWKILRFLVTNGCNYNCSYCHNEGQKKYGRHKQMTFEDFQQVMEAMRHTSIKEIRFSGGEPFINPHLIKMLEWSREYTDLEIGLATNGSLLTEDIADRLKDMGVELTIHLSSLDYTKYHEITMGNLDKFKDNIAILARKGIVYSFNFVAFPSLIRELGKIVAYITRKGNILKILPYLEKNSNNPSLEFFPGIYEILTQNNFSTTGIDSKGIEEFVHPDGARARLLHSPCYSHDLSRCKAYSEVRILPDMRILNCIFGNKSYPLSFGDAEKIRKVFTRAGEELDCYAR